MSSDLYSAHYILELLPQDYLKQQKCILLARIGNRYAECFDIVVGELNDLPFADRLATLAQQWKPDSRKIYTAFHGALHKAGHQQAAKHLLQKHYKLIDFAEITKTIGEDELMDEQMFEIY